MLIGGDSYFVLNIDDYIDLLGDAKRYPTHISAIATGMLRAR